MANVLFKRGSTATINSTAISDGQLLYNTTTGQQYIDSGSTRKEVGKPVDTALSTTSTNAIANNALTNSIINTTAEVSAITADNIPCGTKPVKELITSLNGFRFGVDENGNYGYYKVGADTVSPFKSMIELGMWNPVVGNFSADISAYGNVTTEDVYVICDSVQWNSGAGGQFFQPLKTISGNTLTVSNKGAWTPGNSGLIVFLLV